MNLTKEEKALKEAYEIIEAEKKNKADRLAYLKSMAELNIEVLE